MKTNFDSILNVFFNKTLLRQQLCIKTGLISNYINKKAHICNFGELVVSFLNLIRQNDVLGFVISSIYYNLFISKKSYVDKLNNKISEEMYEGLLKNFRNEIEENEYIKIKTAYFYINQKEYQWQYL